MTDRSRLRVTVLGVLVISLVATLLGRLWYLQVIAAPQYRAQAFQSQVRDIVSPAPRGEIVDDKGRPWVTNKTAVVITVDHTKLAELAPSKAKAVLNRLSVLLHKPFRLLRQETTACTYSTKTVTVKHKPVKETYGTPKHCYNGAPSQPIQVSQAKPTVAATKRAIQIQEMPERFPSVAAKTTAVRQYPRPQGADASTILGYTAPITSGELAALPKGQQAIYLNSDVGVTGLEQYYNNYLRGKPGVKQITVDATGSQTGVVKNSQPKQGDDVITYLDAKAQADLEQEVQAAITHARATPPGYTADYASGVVLNARTGGIVAMASEPTYNPNKPPPTLTTAQYNRTKNEEGSPYVDKAYGSAYPPGSTFKPISASGMLWDGTISTSGVYDCPTTYQGRTNFQGEAGAGLINLHQAIVISCDTFFFELGDKDWKTDAALVLQHKPPREGVQKLAREYGYGSTLRNGYVDLPNATDGHVAGRANTAYDFKHNPDVKDYCAGSHNPAFTPYHRALDRQYCKFGGTFFPGDQMNEDVGQGTVTASPLQVATAYAAIANGGTVFEPRVVKAIVSPTGKVVKRIKPPVRDHVSISQSDLSYLRGALYGVTHESNGTASTAFTSLPNQITVSGKTGTAELTGTNEDGSWFASYGGRTKQKAQYVTVIEVDKAPQGAEGAAPYVEHMYEDLYGVGGHTAVFKNGVPPTALPKVGTAALRQQLKRAQHRRHERRLQQQQPPPTGTTSSPPATSTATPGTNADGLPPALEANRRSWSP